MIRSYISKDMKDWDERLSLISIDLISGLNRHTAQNPQTWIKTISHNLSEAQELVLEKIGGAQLREKRDNDLRALQNFYDIGDVVYLRDSSTKIGISSKIRPTWNGPLIVIRSRPQIY